MLQNCMLVGARVRYVMHATL